MYFGKALNKTSHLIEVNSEKTFCTLGFSGKLCLSKDWLNLILNKAVQRNHFTTTTFNRLDLSISFMLGLSVFNQ